MFYTSVQSQTHTKLKNLKWWIDISCMIISLIHRKKRFCLSGVHHGYVFPSNVVWREVSLSGTRWNLAFEQPHGGQDLDPRHVLSQCKDVPRTQHDVSQQAVSNHAKRDGLLHHEVKQSDEEVSVEEPFPRKSVSVQMWMFVYKPWSTKPVISVSFWKSRCMHHLKTESII